MSPGYDAPANGSRALVINRIETDAARLIFRTHLDLGLVHALARWQASRGIRSKWRTTWKGKVLGDKPFSQGALFHLLRNCTYLGMTVHRNTVHPGLHPANVDADLFGAEQSHMDVNKSPTHKSHNLVAQARSWVASWTQTENRCPPHSCAGHGASCFATISAPSCNRVASPEAMMPVYARFLQS